MSVLVNRGDIVKNICEYLRANVTDLKLVKPYHGELDRYSKKVQLKQNTFPAEVGLTTPFALVISKGRERIKGQGASLKFEHEISIYIGDANSHDFTNENVPAIYSLLDQCLNALHGKVLMHGAGALKVINDGEYLLTTDLFTVYDQRYTQLEIGL